MRSLDRPRHGWEGISNGGEIYGNGSSRRNETDGASEMERLAESIDELLRDLQKYETPEERAEREREEALREREHSLMEKLYLGNGLSEEEAKEWLSLMGIPYGDTLEEPSDEKVR